MKRLVCILIAIPFCLWAQLTGWVEDFNDNSLTGWNVTEEHQRTYRLAEEDSILKITYTRTSASWEWDNFNYTPPQPISVSETPAISVRVRSTVATQLTFKPIYQSGANDWLQENIPGDNAWHEIEFQLTAHGGSPLQIIYIYLDGGSTTPSSGIVFFDDLKIGDAARKIKVLNLQAMALDSNRVELSWSCNYPRFVAYYQIFRSETANCTPSVLTLIDTTAQTSYQDTTVVPHHTYFYKIIAIDPFGVSSSPSSEVKVYTASSGELPHVEVLSINAQQVGLYEKFEAVLLLHAVYQNPYDPDEIDVRARFISPSGKIWEIFGFYDNYKNRDQWKIRFSPNEVGTWKYTIQATDRYGTGQSAEYTFQAIPSLHHGWIRVSPDNPHYLMHDDGTSFYGVGPYYPWSVNNGSTGLGALETYGANQFGYWNITYGGEGNLIESLDSGLGRYDQNKCGRIDQILEWAESRNLVMMLAIWPHDALSATVWAHIWHLNPYNQICNARDFYESETAWKYQEKQYRYLIARWGFSRSLGIWEIVNEINGTDGWQAGKRKEALEWVQKVHQFFKMYDPYGHPTTASQSGGVYWKEGYHVVDLPNVHLYEKSWTPHYSGDPLRSSLWIYGEIARQFWKDFEKPGILGEAGALDNYGNFSAGSPEYLIMYHNAHWASWANGLACAPFWWDFTTKSIFTPELMNQMRIFSNIVKTIDYAHIPFSHALISVSGCDAYAMEGDTTAFGWIRDIQGKNVCGQLFALQGLEDVPYGILWLNPWTGDTVKVTNRVSMQGVLVDQIPEYSQNLMDIVFIAKRAEKGGMPYRLELMAYPTELFSDTSYTSQITCFVLDQNGRLSMGQEQAITLRLEGPGTLEGSHLISTTLGYAQFVFRADPRAGIAQVIASGRGVIGDTLTLVIHKFLQIDDFEAYHSNAELATLWQKRYGTETEVFLDSNIKAEGNYAMRVEYRIGNGGLSYAGVSRSLQGDWSKAKSFAFWLKPDGSGRTLNIRLYESEARYWYYDFPLLSSDSMTVIIPLDQFKANAIGATLQPDRLNRLVFNITQGQGSGGSGILYFDQIQFLSARLSDIAETQKPQSVFSLQLYPIYPNPFNYETVIRYAVPQAEHVEITVYNVKGQQVEVLVDKNHSPGEYCIPWIAESLSTGLYLIQLKTMHQVLVQKCILLK